MYWLKVVLIFIFTLCVSQGTSGNIVSENEDQHIICTSFLNENENTFEEIDFANITINHLLKSIHTDIPAIFCIANTYSKDNQDNKTLLPVITVQHRGVKSIQYITGRNHYLNSHSKIIHSKSYYIYTLEKILI
ncbi:MAG: hypothetical protein SOX26_05805 [Phocaeicola sp.]|nr:hypothetical protein [Phocaeicola sp.]